MQAGWPCVTCPNRKAGFCGALLGTDDGAECALQPSWQHYRGARAGEQVLVSNRETDNVLMLCSGWAFRFMQATNGRRQIINFLLPGDLVSVAAMFENPPRASAQAITEIRLSLFQRSEVLSRLSSNPFFSEVVSDLWLKQVTTVEELVFVLGQRSAEERIAHLFLHLMRRIAARNVIRDHRYRLPLRQQHIADAVGLTPVHVSRVIGAFRDRGLIELSGGVLQVLDPAELERIGSLS